jgi:hypothetical protein
MYDLLPGVSGLVQVALSLKDEVSVFGKALEVCVKVLQYPSEQSCQY